VTGLSQKRIGIALVCGLAVVLGFDATGWDMPMARWFGSIHGFAFRDVWAFDTLLYSWAKVAALGLLLGIGALAVWPIGPWRRMARADRWALFAACLIVIALVPSFKQFSVSACPWDLYDFNSTDGKVDYLSHWDFSVTPAYHGGCFPAGHAVTGFGFFPLVFALWRVSDEAGRRALGWVLFAGFLFGTAQQMRGAHFMSHTLWTCWLCAAGAAALDALWQRVRPRPLRAGSV
jgi:membrane-associated PAP2 superfamily phosphatase